MELELKGEENRSSYECVRYEVVPFDRRAEQDISDPRENNQCDALLKNFELRNCPLRGADAIGGNLKDIFE